MRSIFKTGATALAAATLLSGAAHAEGHALSGELRIFSDMSNPAPRAVMEGMVERFGAEHPDLEIELVITDREAWKTQIRNVLSARLPQDAPLNVAETWVSIVADERIDGSGALYETLAWMEERAPWPAAVAEACRASLDGVSLAAPEAAEAR